MQPCIRFANIDDLSSLLDIEKLSFSQHEYDLLNKKNYVYGDDIYRNIINHLISKIEE